MYIVSFLCGAIMMILLIYSVIGVGMKGYEEQQPHKFKVLKSAIEDFIKFIKGLN